MKLAALFVASLVAVCSVGSATAESVRVRVTARVTNVSDPNNTLQGKVIAGQRVSGVYVYNTNTPNSSGDPFFGEYIPYVNEARLRFAVGGHVFESAAPTQGIHISVFTGGGGFTMQSVDNKPLADGTPVYDIRVQFDGSGNLNQSAALVNELPDLSSYFGKRVSFAGGGAFGVDADIEAVEFVVTDTLVVSPASGSFAANQAFDAAVILPRNSVVSNAHAMANGMLLPLTYPGSCQLQPQVGAGRPSLLCPGASGVLDMAAGAPIEWTIELTNGAILTETVNWTIAP